MPVNIEALQTAQKQYKAIGFDIIPIVPGAKSPPLINNWSKSRLDRKCEEVPRDANIGIRCGGESHIAVIDCDDKNTPLSK